LRPVLSKLAGRLATGPGAFFIAGAIDVGAMFVVYLRWRAAQRRSGRPA
jgi:hypothetical protein